MQQMQEGFKMAIRLCSLASGSSGNCIYVATEEAGVLVDCGMSGKYILNALKDVGVCTSTVKAVLVTHEHSDHTKSLGIISRKLNIPIYANNKTWDSMGEGLGKISTENIRTFSTGTEFLIENLTINTFNIPHDASEPVGYCFYNGGAKVSIATDLGYMSREVKDSIMGSNLVLLESNHDVEMLKMGSYPYYLKRRILGEQGHLSNEAAGAAICELVNSGVKEILLGHLSRENNFPELAYETVKSILAINEKQIGCHVNIQMAPRNSASKLYEIL